MDLEALIDLSKNEGQAITSFTLTFGTNEMKWSKRSAHDHLVNETMLHLRNKIILKEHQINPLTKWEDANWIYSWIQPREGGILLTIIRVIWFNPTVCSIRSNGLTLWTQLPEPLKSKIPECLETRVAHFELTKEYMALLFGNQPPT